MRPFFLTTTFAMAKRARSDTVHSSRPTAKKQRTGVFSPNKIATAEAASAVDENPPLQILLKAVESRIKNVAKGDCVVYWMRMADLRGIHLRPGFLVDTSKLMSIV